MKIKKTTYTVAVGGSRAAMLRWPVAMFENRADAEAYRCRILAARDIGVTTVGVAVT